MKMAQINAAAIQPTAIQRKTLVLCRLHAHTWAHRHILNLEQLAAVILECVPSAMSQLISHYV